MFSGNKQRYEKHSTRKRQGIRSLSLSRRQLQVHHRDEVSSMIILLFSSQTLLTRDLCLDQRPFYFALFQLTSRFTLH